MPTKKIFTPQKKTGKGYVGLFITNELGWCLPEHLHNFRFTSGPSILLQGVVDEAGRPERVFLCKITIEPLKDKKGRPITKIVKGSQDGQL